MKKRKADSNKSPLLLANYIVFVLSMILYGYVLVIDILAKGYSKVPKFYNGSSDYCDFINSHINKEVILYTIGLIIIIYTILIIINFVKRQKCFWKLFFMCFIAIILWSTALLYGMNCEKENDIKAINDEALVQIKE